MDVVIDAAASRLQILVAGSGVWSLYSGFQVLVAPSATLCAMSGDVNPPAMATATTMQCPSPQDHDYDCDYDYDDDDEDEDGKSNNFD